MNTICLHGITASKIKIDTTYSGGKEISIISFLFIDFGQPYYINSPVHFEIKCKKSFIISIIDKIAKKGTELLIDGYLQEYPNQKQAPYRQYIEARNITILPSYAKAQKTQKEI